MGTYVDCYNLTLHKTYLCIPCCSEEKMDVGSYAGIDLNNPPLVDFGGLQGTDTANANAPPDVKVNVNLDTK